MLGIDRQLLSQWQVPIRWGTVVLLVAVLFGAVTSIVDPSLFYWASDGARGEVIIDKPGNGNHDPGDRMVGAAHPSYRGYSFG